MATTIIISKGDPHLHSQTFLREATSAMKTLQSLRQWKSDLERDLVLLRQDIAAASAMCDRWISADRRGESFLVALRGAQAAKERSLEEVCSSIKAIECDVSSVGANAPMQKNNLRLISERPNCEKLDASPRDIKLATQQHSYSTHFLQDAVHTMPWRSMPPRSPRRYLCAVAEGMHSSKKKNSPNIAITSPALHTPRRITF